MKFVKISLILASIQLFQPLPSMAMHSDDSYRAAAQLGFIGTTLGILGTYLGFRYYQSQESGKKVADAAQKKLPQNVLNHIDSFLKEDDTLSHDDKLIFLPAILPINKKIVDDAMQKTIDENKKRIAALQEKECEALADLILGLQANSRERITIALYAQVLSTRVDQNTRAIDLTDKQIKNIHAPLFVKNKTPLSTLLGEPLFPGEVAFIGYSDGSVEIVITDADQQVLKNLTEKERAMLRKWYTPYINHGMLTYTKIVNRREWSEFKSIFSDEHIRTNINRYYNLQVEGVQRWHWRKEAIFAAAFAALYLGVFGVVHFNREMRWHRIFPDTFKKPSCTWLDLPPFALIKILQR